MEPSLSLFILLTLLIYGYCIWLHEQKLKKRSVVSLVLPVEVKEEVKEEDFNFYTSFYSDKAKERNRKVKHIYPRSYSAYSTKERMELTKDIKRLEKKYGRAFSALAAQPRE